MASWFRWTLAVLHILILWVEAERFFQYRDHRDQSNYIRPHKKEIVNDTNEAKVQLEKYGYLRCKPRRKKRSIIGMGISEGIHPTEDKDINADLPYCNDKLVEKAIIDYQRKYKLPETGLLDDATRLFMSTSRCGNKDKEETEVIEGVENSDVQKVGTILTKNPDFQKLTSHFKHKNRPWKRSAKQTVLMKTLTKPSSIHILNNQRQKYYKEYIENLKKESKFLLEPYSKEERQKRSIKVQINMTGNNGEKIWDGQKFTKSDIRWRLLKTGFSTRIPVSEQRASLNLAFRMWSEVIPVKFEEDVSGDIKAVDIEIAFGRGSHQNCGRKFDGHGGEIAHSWSGRNVHFDDEEDYKSIETITMEKDGIYLLRVAVHEIGHVLGLAHTDKSYSIMYAIYHENINPEKEFELGWEDRKEVQKLYGMCRGRFNTLFDWVRKRPDNKFIFNTYFFRNNHYWMYENHANRTRYGDPLYIAREWEGVPNHVDGYLHVWYFAGKLIVDDAFFFKGDKYYKYDSEADKVYPGWPHLISEDFGPKPGETEGVPDNLDSVFFDMRDRNIYFFKGDMVYVFDPKLPPETRGCCERKRKIWEEFPPVEGEDLIPGDLDAVYYSYKDQTVFFLKGEQVWQNVLFHPRQKQIKNGVKLFGNWYEKWYDICDVRNMDSPSITGSETTNTNVNTTSSPQVKR